MKRYLLALFILSSGSEYCHAQATLNISVDAATMTRVTSWCQQYGGYGGITPTPTQVKACVIQLLTAAVLAKENNAAQQALVLTPISQMQ